jgi:hypothetical protein
MTEYRGSRDADGNATVIVVNDDGRRRPLSHFARHSPSGFEWGFAGSGPADLARSIWHITLAAVSRRQRASISFSNALWLPACRKGSGDSQATTSRHGYNTNCAQSA